MEAKDALGFQALGALDTDVVSLLASRACLELPLRSAQELERCSAMTQVDG
jgi:hypothetical protein